MAFPTSNLSGENVLRDVHDQVDQRLRVDAQVTAIIEEVTVNVDLDAADDNVAIKDPVTNNILGINADGSINANVNVNHIEDSIRLGNGTNFLTTTTTGPIVALDVAVSNFPSGGATEATLSSILTELGQKTEPSDAQNIRVISSATDSIDVPGVASETTLSAIDAKLNSLGQKTMAGSVPVVLASDQTALSISLADEPIKMSGTENGQAAGPEFTFVNNVRLQILDAKDRDQDITYADFGTKDQRITQIDYTAPSIGVGAGYTARLTINYTLIGTRYRRDSLIWSII